MSLRVLAFCLAVLHLKVALTQKCDYYQGSNFLDCSYRRLESVPTEELHFNEALTIDLSHNRLSRVNNHTFVNTTLLHTLDLSNNVIENLEPGAFAGLGDLVTLNISANKFAFTNDSLTPALFRPLVSLKTIQIQGYRVPEYQGWKGIDKTFANLINLNTLIMDIPKDFEFGRGFGDLKNLTTISVNGRFSHESSPSCDFETIQNTTFESLGNIDLKQLHLIDCNISRIETNAFKPLKSLKVLDLSRNFKLGLRSALHSLYGLQKRNMSEIRLVMLNNESCAHDNNYLADETFFIYLKNICVKTVDLSENFIFLTDKNTSAKFDLTCLEKLNVSYHSFRCLPNEAFTPFFFSPRLKHVDFSHGNSLPNTKTFVTQNTYFTNGNLKNKKKFWFPLPLSLISLNVSSIGFWLVGVELNFSKPNSMRTFDLSYNNIDNCRSFRIAGLENLTHLDISGTICDTIPPDLFSYFFKLKTLVLSNSANMKTVVMSPVSPFKLLAVLENIDLSGDRLVDLHPKLFENNTHLRSINLANNKLQRLPSALSTIADLWELDVSSNVFTHLLPAEMGLVDGWVTRAARGHRAPFRLRLGDNPFQCTCDTVLFIEWVLQRTTVFDNAGNYSCVLGNGTGVSLFKFGENLTNFKVSCVSHTYLIISVVMGATLLLLVLLFAVLYRYRLNLRYWLYTRLKPPEDMFTNKTYQYEAFVGYTETEYDWMVAELRPRLELQDNPIRLCIHARDFIPGKPIHENIVDKIRESKKIVLIISLDFINSTYGPLEIEYAGMKAVEEGRDDVIVCVLMEHIPVRQMPRALRNLWHKITFLKWSTEPLEQDIFWRNLKQALC